MHSSIHVFIYSQIPVRRKLPLMASPSGPPAFRPYKASLRWRLFVYTEPQPPACRSPQVPPAAGGGTGAPAAAHARGGWEPATPQARGHSGRKKEQGEKRRDCPSGCPLTSTLVH